jgi:hypothetical protein
MNRQEYVQLLGEQTALQRMIEKTPKENVLDLCGLEERLEEIEDLLSKAEIDGREPARALLTFKGSPVVGSHGIYVDFGTKAVDAFTEAVTFAAVSLTGILPARGPLPNRGQHRLLITNTAVGSFGFELEEHLDAQQAPLAIFAPDERSALDLAIERIQNLLECSVNPDDEILADSAAEWDKRTLEKVHDFIKVLHEGDACCALYFRNRMFRFEDGNEVLRSLTRLSCDNLHEELQTVRGAFLGVLPISRDFEFRVADADRVIKGKIAPAMGDIGVINEKAHRQTEIQVIVKRVGEGRPRYILIEKPEWRVAEHQ